MTRSPALHLFATVAWTVVFFALFTLPKVVDDLGGAASDRAGFWWAWLMVLYPVLVPLLSAVAAAVHRTWLLPLGVALAWVPTALLLLNHTALVYAGIFGLLSAAGVAVGGLVVAVGSRLRTPRRPVAAPAL